MQNKYPLYIIFQRIPNVIKYGSF